MMKDICCSSLYPNIKYMAMRLMFSCAQYTRLYSNMNITHFFSALVQVLLDPLLQTSCSPPPSVNTVRLCEACVGTHSTAGK